MKIIFYHQEKKITVENISLSNFDNIEKLLQNNDVAELKLHDLLFYHLEVSSIYGQLDEDHSECCETLLEDAKDISWQQETVN